MIEETPLTPLCCWCHAPLHLDERTAWCSGSQECRDKQLACAISIERDGRKVWLFVPSPKQTEAMMAREPNVFVWGNRGGGKSVCMRWFAHQLAIAIPGFKYAILRTSFPELMKNHLIFLEQEMNTLGGDKHGFSYHKTDHVCYYPNGSLGFYAQCANDADVKKILGAEVALVIFDEAPTFQWDHMRLIAASVRVPAGSGLIPMTRYLGNPVGDSIDELWKYFIDKDVSLEDDPEYRSDEWRAIEMHVQDNPYLDAKQYWKQFSGLPKHFIKAWKEGLRVEERTLFEFMPTKDGKPYHVVSEIPRFGDGKPIFTVDGDGTYHFPDWVRIYRAYDHGFWPDPAVCLWFAVYGKRVLCFKEMTRFRVLAKDIAKEIIAESKGMRVTASYCVPLDAPVWMGDFSFKPLSEIRVGDVVIGTHNRKPTDFALNTRKGQGRREKRVEDHLRRTKVTAIHRTRQEVLKLTMESGREIYCTPDHRWLSGARYPNARKRYVVPKPGTTLVHVVDDPGPCPDREKAAWLGGVYDGEGCRNYIAQDKVHNPLVYEQIYNYLVSLGFDARPSYKHKGSKRKQYSSGVYFNGGFTAAIRFCSWIPALRFGKHADRYLLISKYKTRDKVVSVESRGIQDVGCLTTESGDFIAYGYVSSNCDPSIDIDTGADVLTIKQKMEDAGMPLDCSVNNREIFADSIHSMLEELVAPNTPKMQFLARGCPQTIKYLPRMKFNEKNPAAMADHKYDHWVVTLAYFAMTQIPVTEPTVTTKLRKWQLPKVRGGASIARMIERRMRAR